MNSNIFSIIHISLIRKINIFLYVNKCYYLTNYRNAFRHTDTSNIVNCRVSYQDSLCIIKILDEEKKRRVYFNSISIFLNFNKTGIKSVYIIMIHLHLFGVLFFFNTLFDCLIVHRTESIYTTDLTKDLYLCKHFLIPPYTYPI